MMHEDQGLVSPSEIAEMARRNGRKVSRGAVSNWRSGDRTDFPPRRGGSEARPLFGIAEVRDWLLARNYTITEDRGERRVWSLLNQFRGELAIEKTADVLINVLVCRRMSYESPMLEEAWQEVLSRLSEPSAALYRLGRLAGQENPSWIDLVELPEETGLDRILTSLVSLVGDLDVEKLGFIADDALRRVAAAQARSAGAYGLVGSRVSELLASLAASRRPKTIYDPACGIAEALLKTHETQARDVRLVGHDINTNAVRLARQRCFLAGVKADISVGDVLTYDPDPELRADVIVAEPPLGLKWYAEQSFVDPRWSFGVPPKSSADMAWMQHTIHHLNSGGRSFVITTMGALFRSGAERSIRSKLLQQGCVEAVIVLPGKMLPHTSIQLVLWVLCRPGEAADTGTVLLIDASQTMDPEKHARSWLALDVGSGPKDLPPYAQIDVRDLLGSEAVLTPNRWIERPEAETSKVTDRYSDAVRDLNKAAYSLARFAGSEHIQAEFSTARVVTIKELTQLSATSVSQGRMARDEAEKLGTIVVSASDVRDGLPILHNTDEDALKAFGSSKPYVVTEPGDILVTTMNTIRAVVDAQGGHLLGNGVYRLRMDTSLLDPAYVAHCLRGTWNQRHQSGATIKRADIKVLEIPLIPLKEQRQLVTALDAISGAQRDAETAAAAARDMTKGLLDGLRYDVTMGSGNE